MFSHHQKPKNQKGKLINLWHSLHLGILSRKLIFQQSILSKYKIRFLHITSNTKNSLLVLRVKNIKTKTITNKSHFAMYATFILIKMPIWNLFLIFRADCTLLIKMHSIALLYQFIFYTQVLKNLLICSELL